MSNNNIALTASMRSNLLSLQNTQSLMNKTQDRLSTGYKVNSAMDNPSSYFTAQALNSRANDLSSLLDSIGQAISTLEVADEGITTLQDFVEQAKSIANSARDTSNVSASSTSTVKFNTDTLRSDLVTNQVNGLTPGNSSMTIRLGDATKLDGLTNVSEETALSNLGIGTSGASDIGTLSIDGKAYTIDASGSTKQMTNVQSYGEKSVLKITDSSDWSKAKVEDAAGNKYTLDLTGVTDITGAAGDAKQIKVNAGMEGAIKATVAEDGKTTWELTDKNAWSAVAEHTSTTAYSSGKKFQITAISNVSGNTYSLTLTNAASDTFNIQVTNAALSDVDVANTTKDIVELNSDISVVSVDGELTTDSFETQLAAALTGALTLTDSSADSADAVSMAAATTTTVSGRPIEDLVGASRDIKGTYTYTVSTPAGAGSPNTITFKVSDADADAKTATLTDKDGNVFKNVKLTNVDTSALTGGATFADAKELTISAAAGSSVSLSLSKAENDISVALSMVDGTGAAIADFTGIGAVDDTGTVDADAEGTMVNANTVFIDNGGTVGDMAETLQNMIGNTKLSVSVEDSNLKLKTLDTSSLEVKDGSVLGTNGTANGVGFATAFGLDVGQTIKLDASDTAESLRQKVEAMSRNMRDGRSVTAEFDQNGHMVIKSAEGDDMVISGELADRLGVSGKATNGSNERAIYSQQFNNVLTQIDQLVQDTSYKGINLLKGDSLTVNFNESRTSTIELKGVNFDATGLGFTQAVNEWRTNANIDKSLEQITKATSMLRAQASEFGQNLSTVQIREDFTKNMINNLQSGADKLTLADMNEEAANMLALQTRQQLGVNSLSLASQASQSVLKLF